MNTDADKGLTISGFESQAVRQFVKKLKEIDIELAYLALLTCVGLKPLSRWEKPVDGQGLELLERMDLLTQQIPRTVKTGSQIIETVFSRSAGYVQLYHGRFANRPIDKSAQTQRLEGFLFGFPPCCVDKFIRYAYAKNDLAGETQKILFHWACKNCQITPTLIPAYQKIYDYLMTC